MSQTESQKEEEISPRAAVEDPPHPVVGADDPPPTAPLNLDTVPIEVLLQILNFVDATDLLRNVSLVSKYFHKTLANEMTWKIKMEKRWGGDGGNAYPPIPLLEDCESPPLELDAPASTSRDIPLEASTETTASAEPESPQTRPEKRPLPHPETYSLIFTRTRFPWSRACVKREEQIKLWTSAESDSKLTQVTLPSHIGCIDSIHLFKKQNTMLLACGSRDRTISLWNVEQAMVSQEANQQPESAKLKILNRAHDGWIWDFAVNSDNLFSCSWDTTAKIWDLNTLSVVSQFKSNSALLSISSSNTLTALGSFNRKILFLDPRTSPTKPTGTLTTHTRSVLSLRLDRNYLISCGEDGLVARHDLRTGKLDKKLKLPPTDVSRTPYPTCMSFRETLIHVPYFYVGDNTGNIHLIDLLNFKICNTRTLHSSPVRGVFNNLGSVVSCSRDGKLIVSSSSLGLTQLRQVDVGDKIELPCVHSVDNVVACGGGDGAVRIWGSTTTVL